MKILVLLITICSANALRPRLSRNSALVRAQSPVSLTQLRFKVAEADEVTTQVDNDVEFQDFGDSSSGLLQKLSKGFIPLAASIGFAATPSPLIATRLAGAGTTRLDIFH